MTSLHPKINSIPFLLRMWPKVFVYSYASKFFASNHKTPTSQNTFALKHLCVKTLCVKTPVKHLLLVKTNSLRKNRKTLNCRQLY